MGYGFFNAGIMTVAPKGSAPAKKRIPGRGGEARRAARRLSIAPEKGKAVYPIVQVPPRTDHLKAYTTGLATVQHLLPIDLCTDSLPVLAAVISVLDTTAANENAAEADRQKAAKAMCYLAERLATLT